MTGFKVDMSDIDGLEKDYENAIKRGIDRGVIWAEGNIMKNYLTHGTPLYRRTGALRGSIPQFQRTNRVRKTSRGWVSQVGSRMSYAAAHELGFNGVVAIKAHMRKISQAFGRAIRPMQIKVRAHSRKMNMPKRPFLKPGLEDAVPKIEKFIGEELAKI